MTSCWANLIIHLSKTLDGDKDLNSPRELTAEPEKELTMIEEKLQEAHVDRVNSNLNCILVILPSRISPTGIVMQRDDIILEWIFLPHKPSKKLKTYVEKVSEFIIKDKLRAGEMGQRLRALTAFPEVLSSISSNHIVTHNHL